MASIDVPLPSLAPLPVWQSLLAWYRAQGRDLPWRHTRDPYAILVAEVMLQQTQVERVIPKYHAFLAAFPSFADLAAASAEAVIRAWAPLGYNQRAVRLQRIARAVMTEHGGAIPITLASLMTLPGVGRYTAGAVACFALGQAVAMVDTNVQRVLTRVFIGDLAPEAAAFARPGRALELAEAAVPPTPDEAYAWNQALMDLGATVCVARAPACVICPLQMLCRTYAQLSAQTLFPSGAALPDLRRVAEAGTVYAVRPAPDKRAAPFKGSNRYVRGRILAALRGLPSGGELALNVLGPMVKPDFSAGDLPWLREVASGLARDGLLAWSDATCTTIRLPD